MQRAFSLLVILILLGLFIVLGLPQPAIILLALMVSWIINLAVNLYLRKHISLQLKTVARRERNKTDCVVTFTNDSLLPVIFLKGRLRIENTFTGEVTREKFIVPLRGKGANSINMEVEGSNSGKYRVEMEKLYLGDFLGLVDMRIKEEGHCNFTIIPNLIDLNIDYDPRESNTYDNELYSQYKKGQDRSEVFQIREYEQGDEIRQIHWKLSSKLNKLVVKDASSPLDKKMVVAVDKTIEKGSKPAYEAFAELAVSICQRIIESGITYRLIWNDPSKDALYERDIQFEDDFIEAIPDLLTGQPETSKEDLDELYQLIHGAIEATHVIYLSFDKKDVSEKFFGDALAINIASNVKNYAGEYANINLC